VTDTEDCWVEKRGREMVWLMQPEAQTTKRGSYCGQNSYIFAMISGSG